MSAVRVAFAPADKAAAMDLIATLKAAGMAASAAPLRARRAAAQPAPEMIVWTRQAAADPRIRALLRSSGPAPLVARLDDAPAPPGARASVFDPRDPGAIRRLSKPAAQRPAPPPPKVAAAVLAQEDARPAKRKGGVGWLIALVLVLAAAAGGYGAWQGGYLDSLLVAASAFKN